MRIRVRMRVRVTVRMGVVLSLQPLLANLALASVVLVQQCEHMLGVHVSLQDMAFCRCLLYLVV